MAFKAVKGDNAKAVALKMTASATVAVGDILTYASGYLQRVTSSTAAGRNNKYLCLEDKTTGSGETPEILVLPTADVLLEADTASTVAQTLVGTFIDFTDHDTLNQAASSTDVFYVESIVSTAGKVRGYLV